MFNVLVFTILSGDVCMSTVSVSEQSAGSATKMPLLARACTTPQWFRLW